MKTPSEPTGTKPGAKRSTAAVVIVSALLGALIGGGVVFLSVVQPSASKKPPAAATKIPSSPSASTTTGNQNPPGSEWATPLASARQLESAGRLREAQEEYLSILLIEPTHEDAMRGLVSVVRRIARGDRSALQRQAEEYRRAVALGIETEEHYTAPAMELLARASLQAAGVRTAAAPSRRAHPCAGGPSRDRPPGRAAPPRAKASAGSSAGTSCACAARTPSAGSSCSALAIHAAGGSAPRGRGRQRAVRHCGDRPVWIWRARLGDQRRAHDRRLRDSSSAAG